MCSVSAGPEVGCPNIFDSDFYCQLYRITLLGNVPAGVGGRPSVALKGDPIRSGETELTGAAG